MKNLNFYSIFDFLLIPVKTFVFKYLLILNMISNFGVSIYFHDVFSIFSIITLAAFTAYLETVLCISIRIKFLKLSLFIFLAIFHNILIAIDYYLIFHFQMPIGQDAIDVLADTNPVEAQNFMMTYLSFHVVLLLARKKSLPDRLRQGQNIPVLNNDLIDVFPLRTILCGRRSCVYPTPPRGIRQHCKKKRRQRTVPCLLPCLLLIQPFSAAVPARSGT